MQKYLTKCGSGYLSEDTVWNTDITLFQDKRFDLIVKQAKFSKGKQPFLTSNLCKGNIEFNNLGAVTSNFFYSQNSHESTCHGDLFHLPKHLPNV